MVDVSARDGLQSLPTGLQPEARARWIRLLLDAGIPEVEAGALVRADKVPQMAGTAEVIALLPRDRDRLWVLVPNLAGLREADHCGVRNVVCLLSATETHSRANLGRPVQQVLEDLDAMAAEIRARQMQARVAVSMAWIDPTEGQVPVKRVARMVEHLRSAGFPELTLCDTYGGASPQAVVELLSAIAPCYRPEAVGLHLHDTFGFAAANALAGLMAGVVRFDAAIGGLGGCPFAPGARGNLATGHLLHLLASLEIETGVDRIALQRAESACLRMLPAAPETDARIPTA